jgi:hypothetical protein
VECFSIFLIPIFNFCLQASSEPNNQPEGQQGQGQPGEVRNGPQGHGYPGSPGGQGYPGSPGGQQMTNGGGHGYPMVQGQQAYPPTSQGQGHNMIYQPALYPMGSPGNPGNYQGQGHPNNMPPNHQGAPVSPPNTPMPVAPSTGAGTMPPGSPPGKQNGTPAGTNVNSDLLRKVITSPGTNRDMMTEL